MIRFTAIWELPMDNALADRWYYRTHSQEGLERGGPWIRRYWTYRSFNVGPEADIYTVARYRLTELWYDSIASRNEALPHFGTLTPPPQSWSDPRYKFHNGIIHIPAAADDRFVDSMPPAREQPYVRWMMLLKYPDDVPVADGEQWYREVHAKELSATPGLLRFVSYRNLDPLSDTNPWVRMSELWFDGYDVWRKAFVESPVSFTAPEWNATFPYVDNLCTFVGDQPDIDWLRTKIRLP